MAMRKIPLVNPSSPARKKVAKKKAVKKAVKKKTLKRVVKKKAVKKTVKKTAKRRPTMAKPARKKNGQFAKRRRTPARRKPVARRRTRRNPITKTIRRKGTPRRVTVRRPRVGMTKSGRAYALGPRSILASGMRVNPKRRRAVRRNPSAKALVKSAFNKTTLKNAGAVVVGYMAGRKLNAIVATKLAVTQPKFVKATGLATLIAGAVVAGRAKKQHTKMAGIAISASGVEALLRAFLPPAIVAKVDGDVPWGDELVDVGNELVDVGDELVEVDADVPWGDEDDY